MVSLIMPLYNRNDFVISTLQSVSNQSDSNWECIIVDDGSTDDSYKFVSDYIRNDSRFRLYNRTSEYKKGGNGARNYGFDLSKGDYINFIDSDDVLHPDFVKLKLNAIINSDADAIISKTVITALDVSQIIRYEERTIITSFMLDDFITLKASWYIVDPIWRKEFLVEKKMFDEHLLKGQDRDFHIRRLLEKPKIEILDEYLYYYRTNPKSISADVSEQTALTMLEVGIKRNFILKKYGIRQDTEFFVFRQMIRLYPFLFKSKEVKTLYFKVFRIFFKFSRKYVILSTKFFITILSFQLFGKGERLLK